MSRSPTMQRSEPAFRRSIGRSSTNSSSRPATDIAERDDIRGLCWNWPCGLVRRGLLEAGRRLHARGGVHDVEHVVELFPDELDRILRGGGGPSADELAERAAERDRVEATPPPRMLGDPEDPPPLDAFPKAMARATAALMVILECRHHASRPPEVEPSERERASASGPPPTAGGRASCAI